MKKLLFASILLSSIAATTAQRHITKPVHTATPPTADNLCAILHQFAKVANVWQLKTLQGTPATSKYFKDIFGGKLYSSSLNIPNALESFIDEDPNPKDGSTYHAFLKDYGADEAAARADFERLRIAYIACFKGLKGAVIRTTELETHIVYKKCRIQLHTYNNSLSNSWVSNLSITSDY
jgi:hypothetical protein